MTTSDLIIIGSGPGGYHAADYAARNGLTVTIFERGQLGGTCLNEGCIPTKALARNAEVLRTVKEASAYGIGCTDFQLDFAKVLQRKDMVVEQLRNGVATLLSQPGITLVSDIAEFCGDHTVKAVSTGEEYHADTIIIATGSRPKLPPHVDIEAATTCDSSDLLSLPQLPRRLCIVGAGVIGMEFASIFQTFGSEVIVVEFMKECLPSVDADIAKRLRKSMERRGIVFHMQSAVKSVKKSADGTSAVTFERKGKEEVVEADTVLMAVGRQPDISVALQGGIDCDGRHGIIVTDDFETSVKGIYAIGDCNGRQMLAHAAAMQGIHVVNRLLCRKDNIRFDIMPAAVFTYPEVASVGSTEQQLKDAGREYRCLKGLYRANGKAMASGETEGLVKLLMETPANGDASTGRLLGCHVMGSHAADLVQEATALIHQNATLGDLRDIIHTHPTLEEILHDAALQAY